MKRIVRLTESDLARIVKRVINERQYLMEGVPNTTLVGPGSVTLESRTICGTGDDYIKMSFIVENTGKYDAYLTTGPRFIGQPFSVDVPLVYNVTIGGKAVWGQADTQNAPKVPAGKKATVNFVIRTNFAQAITSKKAIESTDYVRAKQYVTDYMTKLKALTSATIKLTYNGGILEVPVTVGAMSISTTQACDAKISLPQGF
jgi:hypothetical protein